MNITFDNGLEHMPSLWGDTLRVRTSKVLDEILLLSEDHRYWRALVSRSECDTPEKLQLFADICAARYGLPVIIEGENT